MALNTNGKIFIMYIAIWKQKENADIFQKTSPD